MSRGSGQSGFGVAICTRERPERLRETLDALRAQTRTDFPVVVVDQSEQVDEELRREESAGRVALIHDRGRGLSRARNLAWASVSTEWVAYIDDDCTIEPEWAEELARTLLEHPEADFVSGHVDAGELRPDVDGLVYTVFPVERERTFSGRWVRPGQVGFGVCMVVRRAMIERVGGWDERLGPGVEDFPAGDDIDFNYRVLRAGGVIHHTPTVRSHHHQWRSRDEVVSLYAGYMTAWMGCAVKTLRTGDPLGGMWIGSLGVRFIVRMFASSVRHRSALRHRVAWASVRGLARGLYRASRRRW